VNEAIKEVYRLRKDLANNERLKENERSQSLNNNSKQFSIMKREFSKEKLNPGHFMNPIQTLFAQYATDDESQKDPKAVLGHAEFKEMKDFVARAWKELNMIQNEEKRKENSSSKEFGQRSHHGSPRSNSIKIKANDQSKTVSIRKGSNPKGGNTADQSKTKGSPDQSITKNESINKFISCRFRR
jgi:hypothetical protein